MGGSDEKDNLVYLTAKAHYVAHHLLHKGYPENKKLASAFGMMLCGGDHQNRRFTPRMYDSARKAISESRRGIPRPDLAELNRLRKKHPPKIKKERVINREAFKLYNERKKKEGWSAEERALKSIAGKARRGIPVTDEGRLNMSFAAHERYKNGPIMICSMCGHKQKRSPNFYRNHEKNCRSQGRCFL